MRFKFLGFLGLALCASAAHADIGYCHANFGRSFFFTEVIELPEGTEYVSVHRMFQDWIERRTDRTASDASCNSFSSRAEAENMRSIYLRNLASENNPVEVVSGFPGSSATTGGRAKLRPNTSRSPLSNANSSGPKPANGAAPSRSSDAATTSPPHRPKMTNAEADAKFEADKAEYQRKLAQNAAEYKAAQKRVENQKAEQRAAAERALAAHQQQLQAHDQAVRNQQEAYAAEVAKYESELAAQKVRADFDKRNGLGKASTDTDANRCVTTAETKVNATFKGNTAASIINGCGRPVDVRICLMTDRGWNCGVRWGVASQDKASFSSFNATGQVFVDAKITGSSKPLASPN